MSDRPEETQAGENTSNQAQERDHVTGHIPELNDRGRVDHDDPRDGV